MSQTKREQVTSHLRYLRQELREMHLGIKEDDLFPESGELRGLMAQLEALLELKEGNTKIQSKSEDISKIIIGNGTNSKEIIDKLGFFKKEIITFEEKHSTFRAKARYFELFPIRGLKFLIPREVFILNKNLDAISALIILEDYCKMKFTLSQNIDSKTWLK